jgi:hypothetical protein
MKAQYLTTDNDRLVSGRSLQRQIWQRPELKAVPAGSAETGVNSTTDATATFS